MEVSFKGPSQLLFGFGLRSIAGRSRKGHEMS